MTDLADSIFIFIGSSIFVAFCVLVVMLGIKRRRQRLTMQASPDGPLNETAQDLALAEEELRNLPIDIREALIDTHELFDRYTTHRGYSNVYMEAFTKRIRDAGIPCETVFQTTLPMGVADAIVEPQGVFELYVERGKMDEAKRVIPGLIEPVQKG